MAFTQFKLDKSINQSRGIFDKYIYESETDSIDIVTASGYFDQSRFIDDPGWQGGIIECRCSDGYIVGEINGDSITILLQKGTTYGPLSNANILAISSPSDEETAFSTDDFIVYVFFNGNWYSTGGGILS